MSFFTSLIGPLVGGLLGSQGEKETKSTTIDPRLGRYVYGEDGKGGLLGDYMLPLFRQQMAQGGLNDMQRGGMEMQRQTLMSPQFTQGYDAMRSLGMSLMGGGVAQNPFTNAEANRPMPSAGQAVARPNTNTQYQPFSYAQTPAMQAMNTPIQSAAEYQRANPMPNQSEAAAAIDAYLARIGYDGSGSGEMGSYGGFDGGLLGMLGLDGGGQSVGNNGGKGLGSAMGGADVSMGSAAGNGGDNGAEMGSDGGMSGSDGNGGGFGGDSGDGYAKGGKVTKKRLSGPNPKGPDDGYAALDAGEYVINAKSAKRIGHDKLARMNRH